MDQPVARWRPWTQLLSAQGIVGSIPWSGMVFLTLYFQLLGMSDFAASLQMALLLGSTALGGLLGGWIGDKAATKYPDHGRILVCQFSVAVGIPFSLTITKASPLPPRVSDSTSHACRFLEEHWQPGLCS